MWCLVWAWVAIAAATEPLDVDLDADPPSDDADAFRRLADTLAALSADDEIEAWEAWVDANPSSPYRDRALARIDALTAPRAPIPEPEIAPMRLAQGVLMEDFDPRTRIKAGFQLGLPEYVDLFVDYEHALAPTLSLHGGVRHRATGWSVEAGTHWAPIHTTSGTIVALVGDVRFNTAPSFAAVRPQLAFGQRLGRVDLAVIGGADVELREGGGPTWLIAGNATVRMSDTVRAFAELGAQRKHAGWPTGGFRYDTATLGLTFLMGRPERRDALTTYVGATVPWFYRWWVPNQGSALVRVDANLD